MIIQQFIDAEALNVDGLGDLTGKPVCIVPWRKLLSRMGETERSVTIEYPELVALAERLSEKVGIIGPFDVDFFRDANGKLWVLEMNLRFGGGYPVSHLAGADFPRKILALICGENVVRSTKPYQSGVSMMKELRIIPGPIVPLKVSELSSHLVHRI
jgi:carbamoyl-phosphate synthase large subunit